MPAWKQRRRGALAALVVVLALAAGGCGGGSDSTGGPQQANGSAGGSAAGGGEPADGGELPGIKGEEPGAEAATELAISGADCAQLRARAEALAGEALKSAAEPSPPSSRCRLTGPRVQIGVYLDAAHAARQRYFNRIDEQQQFGAPDPAMEPHGVPGVGDPAAGNHDANWVPSLGSLFAVRGNRWLTVSLYVEGKSERRQRAAAADLARLGFRLSDR